MSSPRGGGRRHASKRPRRRRNRAAERGRESRRGRRYGRNRGRGRSACGGRGARAAAGSRAAPVARRGGRDGRDGGGHGRARPRWRRTCQRARRAGSARGATFGGEACIGRRSPLPPAPETETAWPSRPSAPPPSTINRNSSPGSKPAASRERRGASAPSTRRSVSAARTSRPSPMTASAASVRYSSA